MSLTKEVIDDIMFLFDEERQPISEIAYQTKYPIGVIQEVICSVIANNIVEVV